MIYMYDAYRTSVCVCMACNGCLLSGRRYIHADFIAIHVFAHLINNQFKQ